MDPNPENNFLEIKSITKNIKNERSYQGLIVGSFPKMALNSHIVMDELNVELGQNSYSDQITNPLQGFNNSVYSTTYTLKGDDGLLKSYLLKSYVINHIS